MMAATQRLASSASIEAEQGRARALGQRHDAHEGLGDDAELPLRAADQAEEIEARGIERGAADVDDFALEGDEPHPQQMVAGDAVFEAMRAAGIVGDIAAEGAGELRGRVGRIEEAVRRHRLGDREIGDAGLDAGVAVGGS